MYRNLSQNGRSFIIKNQSRFSKELLPLYFKHNNMASFIRQLNMCKLTFFSFHSKLFPLHSISNYCFLTITLFDYFLVHVADGFRKLTSIENSGLKSEKDDMEFFHQYFLKGQEGYLEFIKRKVWILMDVFRPCMSIVCILLDNNV